MLDGAAHRRAASFFRMTATTRFFLHGALACVFACGLAGCGRQDDSPPPALHGARLAAVVDDVLQVPASAATRPLARINYLFAAPDASHRMFVADMAGKVYVVRDGALRGEPFLDLAAARKGRFTSANLFEEGLATFAFHPDFAQPARRGFRRFYTFATEQRENAAPTFAQPVPATASGHHAVVIEWQVDASNDDRIDPASAREVMRIAQPRHDHVGGQIAFNPAARPGDADHGKLYVGVGDGGNTELVNNQVDDWQLAQNRRVPLGKILRIDPLADGGRPYGVPADNPFVGREDTLPEIWALGLRNPQRFSWDTGGSHKMLIADIGQSQLEEIDVGRAGANYGWGEREGPRMVKHGDSKYRLGLPFLDFVLGYTYPALVYGHHLGRAVTGGFVYRGEALPQLRGMYVFGDIASGKIFFADVQALDNSGQAAFYELPLVFQGKPATLRQMVGAERADLRFGVDDRGEIHLLTKQDGRVRRLSALVPAEVSIWPVEYPVAPLESSWWESVHGRIEATARAVLRRR